MHQTTWNPKIEHVMQRAMLYQVTCQVRAMSYSKFVLFITEIYWFYVNSVIVDSLFKNGVLTTTTIENEARPILKLCCIDFTHHMILVTIAIFKFKKPLYYLIFQPCKNMYHGSTASFIKLLIIKSNNAHCNTRIDQLSRYHFLITKSDEKSR